MKDKDLKQILKLKPGHATTICLHRATGTLDDGEGSVRLHVEASYGKERILLVQLQVCDGIEWKDYGGLGNWNDRWVSPADMVAVLGFYRLIAKDEAGVIPADLRLDQEGKKAA